MSAKTIILMGIIALLSAVIGAALAVAGWEWGKRIVYVSVPCGAIVILIGGLAASVGGVGNDLHGGGEDESLTSKKKK